MRNRNNIFDAGTLEIEVVNISKVNGREIIIAPKFVPNSAKIGMNFGDVSYSIEFNVPSISKYFFELNDGNEVKIYIDGEFYCGGYFISRNPQNNSWSYSCIGYGYEIAKTACVELTGFTANMEVGNFILKTIEQNLVRRNKKIVKINPVTRQTLGVDIENIPISFVIYDPFNHGDEIITTATEAKTMEKILPYLNKFLKPKNIFIRCLGTLGDLKPHIQRDILNNRMNNTILSNNPNNAKVFVLELYKAITKQTGGSLVLDPNKKTTFTIRSKGDVYDNVINQQANYKIDYSNRYGCYYATSKNSPKVDTNTNNNFAEDPVISDGSVDIVQFDLNLTVNGLQSLLYYEVNKRIAESHTYNCTVLGFRQGLNINNVNNGIAKINLAFWDINHNVKITDIKNGLDDNQFLIKGITLNWGKDGAKTNLSCTLPNSYSLEKSPTELEKDYLDEIIREQKRKVLLNLDENIKKGDNYLRAGGSAFL